MFIRLIYLTFYNNTFKKKIIKSKKHTKNISCGWIKNNNRKIVPGRYTGNK